MNENLLKIEKLTKSYGGNKVLEDVSIEIKTGEIHALVGANGAGKSTLIKTISGAIEPDSGVITFDGINYSCTNPILSSQLGIEVIYQELNLVSNLSVAENIYLGQKFDSKFFSNKDVNARAQEILDVFELDLHPTTLVRDLSVAYMQIVEIAKALSHNVRLLILDEPTAPLTEKEVKILFRLIKQLQEKGVSIIYISHRLEEIFEISDRVTVLRDGKKIETMSTRDTNRKALIELMINNDFDEVYPPINDQIGEPVFTARNLSGKNFRDISFTVHAGEVLGLEGLVGSRRTEIIRSLFGADPIVGGEILLGNEVIGIKNPSEALKLGIAMIPEDRKTQGIIGNLSVVWNTTLTILQKIQKFLVVENRKEKAIFDNLADVLSIKFHDGGQPASTLSGGNQQKIVFGKGLVSNPKVIMMDEPTRGIDVGAKKEIYKLISDLAHKGLAIIFVSSDLDEMIGLCNRLIILSEGEIVTELKHDEFTKHTILNYASGSK